MATLDVLTYGFMLSSDQGSLGYSTISLLSVGSRNIVIDTGPPSRRNLLHQALRSRNLDYEDIDTVILTHLHWDHCLNVDLFRNARILVNPKELDYARNPNRGDVSAAWYVADMMGKMKVEAVSDGDKIADGVSIVTTPGHTIGHNSILVEVGGEKILVAGDALPDGGTVKRGKPHNIFWDVKDATESVEKMLDVSRVFYPGHDRPFRMDGKDVSYLHGPNHLEISTTNESGSVVAVSVKVHSHQPINVNTVQKKQP